MKSPAFREATIARPFLKWAGGKTQLLGELESRILDFSGRYFEPFVGGGACFFSLASAKPQFEGRLNDLNHDLIQTYTTVRDQLDQLLNALRSLEEVYLAGDADERESIYYDQRRTSHADALSTAARLIFLNKTCFNGLYRVNRDGQFNVPHGRYLRPKICDAERLRGASAALRGMVLTSVDFVESCATAGTGDLVYFDPPYHPLSTTSRFTAYTDRDFGAAEQRRLRECADRLTERGARVIISNSSHPSIQDLYQSGAYRIARVKAGRAINSRGDRRGPIEELLITNDAKAPAPAGRGSRPASSTKPA